jgi:hypothetical protein
MPPIAYTVTATLPDEPAAARYLAWLTGGHSQAVLAGGAHSATICRLDPPASPAGATPAAAGASVRAEVRYLFPDRPSFDHYISEHAPKLREDGLRHFPPSLGVTFERRIGEVVAIL